MSRRVHTVRSAVVGPVQQDRKPVQRGRRREGLDCNTVSDKLAEVAAILWEDRWSPFYGTLGGPLLGAATRKPISRRLGLMVVCVALVLVNVAPPAVRWDLSLTTDQDGQPIKLVMTRDDPEARHTARVQLADRSLRIGDQPAFALTTRDASMKAMRAIAAEAGAFFGAPVRSAEVA